MGDNIQQDPLVTEADHLNDKPEDHTLAADAAASADLLEALEGPSRPSGHHAISAQAKSAHGDPCQPCKKVIRKKAADKKNAPKMSRANVYSRAYHSTLQKEKAWLTPIELAKSLARAAAQQAVQAWTASLDA